MPFLLSILLILVSIQPSIASATGNPTTNPGGTVMSSTSLINSLANLEVQIALDSARFQRNSSHIRNLEKRKQRLMQQLRSIDRQDRSLAIQRARNNIIKQRLKRLDSELAQQSQRFHQHHPSIVALKEQIASLKAIYRN